MARKTFKMVGGRKLKQHLRQIQTRKSATATIGVHNDQRYEDGTFVALAAMVNEYGRAGIPPRPALRTALRAAREKCVEVQRRIYRTAIRTGQPPDTRALVAAAAAVIQREMEEEIRSGRWTPNAPATVEGKEGSTPLIDTARYAKAIAWRWQTGGLLL